MGGTLSLHGTEKNSWTKLAKNSRCGQQHYRSLESRRLEKRRADCCRVNRFRSPPGRGTNHRGVSGKVITLDQKLHICTTVRSPSVWMSVVSRHADSNIVSGFSRRRELIQWRACDGDGWVNHESLWCRVLSNGSARDLARYPIHWHLVGDTQGQYIENSAIHHTFSRCVTVHGTTTCG